ncbi:nitric oxide synthase oxygenase [Actinomycetospora straminea]|uniref:Nitric oxide synthase oxygenase n=1 Tax=Actinomycetospora straminea TaxID=663607 RepID=A0ABP9EEZ8_9PSEU|nr:nitric oxide synthase oxygenase [Actinomycetospora straminea]MDD7932023.1 nitric oxide synthase oxygenase [Actinomycetospora straminea]
MTRGVAIEAVGSGDHTTVPTPHPRPRPRPRVPSVVGTGAPVSAVPPEVPSPEVPEAPAGAEDLVEAPVAVAAPDVVEAPAADPAPEQPVRGRTVDPAEAEEFLRLFHAENPAEGPVEPRVAAVRDEIARTGTYVHTTAELEFGARVAWRSSARCIGRLYWRSLHLRDRRHVTAPDEVAAECVGHLHEATRRGRIRSTITVFAPDGPSGPGPRIWNEQLVRYAGYRAGGRVLGDPRYVGFTDNARALGWMPPSPMGRFDVLPLVVSGGGEHVAAGPQVHEVPADAVLEVPLSHPDFGWFGDLDLRWHALPVISNMRLDIGGISYPAAPFNGWYMATEIAARNFADADRYDLLPDVAEAMGLDTSSERTLWRDRAAVELTAAVQHSFDEAGVSLADHHGESQRFLRFVEKEEAAGRTCPVDWSWIVPPISGGLTPVFHRYYDEPTDTGPMFRLDEQAKARGRGCPV